ncbi:DUF2254 domain-containing protein [Rhodovarius crocodyli]|uniref:DUF2254 domain-containing protein n=1 Tax=Rhodovarius crocodyli TaxID=1979269 RepID=A0A437MEP8_9PROT|nr:DUF2254 domain-containing protein [Rhodovarius crocodyli]RVT96151.1 DUF2254 domain-containing protein [Rhodovarius crocodyli]
MPRWRWLLANVARRLWVRATLIGLLGVLAALMAAVVERYIPWHLPGQIGADAVEGILSILASSMLAVTTFSLSIMVSAYGSATSNVTPRATKLLIEDRLTQTALSAFLGSFLFGIVGLILLKTGAYGERGRVVLFAVTIAVIVLVVVSLLRWIDHLTRFGRVGETTVRVEEAARAAIEAWVERPCLGGTPLRAVPESAAPVTGEAIGYVQHIDMPALADLCDAAGVEIFVNAVPGTFIYPDTPLALVDGLPPERRHALIQAFTIGDVRSFDQDPRFGLAVLSEIASRALSPAVNDPGTAIDVIGRCTRLMCRWAAEAASKAPEYPQVHVPAHAWPDLLEDAFMPIARDGAAMLEVQLRLQKALLALARTGGPGLGAAALEQSRQALSRAEGAMPLEADKARLRAEIAASAP